MITGSVSAGQYRSSTGTIARVSRDRPFIVICALALAFAVAVAITIYGSQAMGGGMPMRGGWTMSMAWTRMPDQSWLAAYSMFCGMWLSMMTAMMIPVLAISLLQFRRVCVDNVSLELNALTAAVAGGYSSVWAVLGLALFPIGSAIARALMATPELARWVPTASTLIIITAGYFQLTQWKARSLCRCRSALLLMRPTQVARIADGWGIGIALGRDCLVCCSGLMVVLIGAGLMNLVSMAVVTIAITAERVHGQSQLIARVTGGGIIIFALCNAYSAWERW